MSGTATEFTAAATARLDDYLRQVRAALAAAPDLDADDIEADIREHVAAEFRAHTRPVALVELERVLVALGPPAGWAPAPTTVPAPGFNPWALVGGARRRLLGVIGVLWRGPEDWRLAYLCLIATVLAVATMGILLPVAYLLGRAAVALAAEKGQPLGARRWLVYPPVVLVSLPLFLAVTFWPVALLPLTLNAAVWPAEQFREHVAEVRDDNTVILRREPVTLRLRDGRMAMQPPPMPLTRVDGAWRINPSDRAVSELTLRTLDRMPFRSGVLLSLFAALGGLLAWGLVVGLVGWQFPRTVAAVFFPLLPADGRGAARLAVGCGAGFVVWAGFAARLAGGGVEV